MPRPSCRCRASPRAAFDAALLIAIREKELGIPATVDGRPFDSAGRSAGARQSLRCTPSSRQAVLDAAQLIIGDTTALDPEQRALVTGRNRPPLEPDNPKRRALDAALDNRSRREVRRRCRSTASSRS